MSEGSSIKRTARTRTAGFLPAMRVLSLDAAVRRETVIVRNMLARSVGLTRRPVAASMTLSCIDVQMCTCRRLYGCLRGVCVGV